MCALGERHRLGSGSRGADEWNLRGYTRRVLFRRRRLSLQAHLARLNAFILVFAPLACDSSGSETPPYELPRIEVNAPTAEALCEHTREVLGDAHGGLGDKEWAAMRASCAADFDKKREQWGGPLYETFLSCALRAEDMRTLVECDQVARRQAGLAIDSGDVAQFGVPEPGGKLVYEALLKAEGPALVGPIATVIWGANSEEISARLPEVQRRIYRPSAHLLEAEWSEGLDGLGRLIAWRIWLPEGTQATALVEAWGQPRFAEDEAGEHQLWQGKASQGARQHCVSYTKPSAAKTGATSPASTLPYLRLLACVALEDSLMHTSSQRLLKALLDSKNLDQALARGGRFIFEREGIFRLARTSDKHDLTLTSWALVVENEKVVALELWPNAKRDPTLPERVRKLASQEWEFGLHATWTEAKTLVLTLGPKLDPKVGEAAVRPAASGQACVSVGIGLDLRALPQPAPAEGITLYAGGQADDFRRLAGASTRVEVYAQEGIAAFTAKMYGADAAALLRECESMSAKFMPTVPGHPLSKESGGSVSSPCAPCPKP